MTMHAMMLDVETYYRPGMLVYIAGAFHFVGLIITRQVVLRLLLMAGSCLYVFYYATVAETPLWDAIYISFMIITANVIGLSGARYQGHIQIPSEPLLPSLVSSNPFHND